MASSVIEQVNKIRTVTVFLLKDLVRDRWRTTITVLNLLVFICCYFCLAALARAASAYGDGGNTKSSLMILQSNVFDPADSIITQDMLLAAREYQPDLVSAVSPVIFRFVKIENQLVQLRAVPRQDLQPVFRLDLDSGNWPQQRNELMLGKGTAIMTGWETGRQITVFGREYRISGIVNSPGTKYSSIWMDIDEAEQLFATSGIYQFLWLNITPGVDADEAASILQNDPRLGNGNQVYYVDHLYEQYASALNDVAGTSSVLVFLCLLAVMIGTYGNVYLTLSERSREFTILRAVGYSPKTVRWILTGRSLAQLVIAFLGGWLLSLLILDYLSGKFPIIVHSILVELRITPFIFFAGLGLAVLFGWLGVMLSTLKETRAGVHSMMER